MGVKQSGRSNRYINLFQAVTCWFYSHQGIPCSYLSALDLLKPGITELISIYGIDTKLNVKQQYASEGEQHIFFC